MGSANRHVRRQMAKFAGKVDKKAIKRILATEAGRSAGATAPGGDQKSPLERRMPEKDEKFVLSGIGWATPVLFSLEGYTDDGRAIIRFAKKEDFQPKIASKEAPVAVDEITAPPGGLIDAKIDWTGTKGDSDPYVRYHKMGNATGKSTHVCREGEPCDLE